MNPQKWGPAAWRFMEQVAYNPLASPGAKQKFFKLMSKLLPCAKCRDSYRKFIKNKPLQGRFLDNPRMTSLWLYQIHNLVNDKLRNQGRTTAPDPSFEEVYQRVIRDYRTQSDTNQTVQYMFDFLYWITMNYDSAIHKSSVYQEYFEHLARVMPYQKYREAYQILLNKFPVSQALKKGQKGLFEWLYTIHQALEIEPSMTREQIKERYQN